MNSDEHYMDIALQIAQAAKGQTEPNPMVGAVIVKDGEIVGMGAHLRAGEPHAEVHALRMAGDKVRGSTLYVTLEPCSHYGRTPPCVEAVIQSGVSKAIVAALDPNPLVAGRGVSRLKESGIEVITGVREKESRKMNEVFEKFIVTGKPFITVKTASTLDGKVATESGSSRWITGEEARRYVHQLRDQNQGILVGINTVLADDPELTTRLPDGGRNPIRMIVDSRLRITLKAKVVTDGQAPTWIFTTEQADEQKKAALEQQKGVKVIPVSSGPQVDLGSVLSYLGKQNISSVLVEGGSEVNGSLLHSKSIDKVISFIAPKLIGGQNAPTSFGGQGMKEMGEAVLLKDMTFQQMGEDLCIQGYPDWRN